MKPQSVQFSHWLEDHSMHVLLKGKGSEEKGLCELDCFGNYQSL